jgi:Electron transfer DM13
VVADVVFTGAMLPKLLRNPVTWIVMIAVTLVAFGFGLYWFQPWRLVTNTTVNDAVASPAPATSSRPGPAGSRAPAGPRVVLKGTFITHEHDTSGEARVVEYPDGRRQLELLNLNTSDGPDLRVWLSDQPVKPGTAGWRVFDDGKWVELGRLKGNKGNQVYDVPRDADLKTLRSVTIWCKRFSVSFGAAALA